MSRTILNTGRTRERSGDDARETISTLAARAWLRTLAGVNTALFALVAATLAAAAVWLVLRQQAAVLGERLRARDAESVRLTAELSAARDQLAEISSLKSKVENELSAERAGAEARAVAEQQRFGEQEKRTAQYLADIEKIRATLQVEFQAVASKLLDEKSTKFTDHNKAQVEALLYPLRQQLTDFRQRVDIVYKTESDDRSALKAQIEQLRLLNTRITDEAHALTTALKGQSQTRGAWGELVIDRLLENTGLIKGQNYLTQESIATEDGRRLRPDIILRLPDQRHLIIDSKVSLIAYGRAVDASDEATRLAAIREHIAAVRTHVEQLSAKKYEDAGNLITPNYVLMFVPIEPAFVLAVENDRALYEWAFDRRVIVVTASGLLATLKTIDSIWKQERRTRNAEEIADRGGRLYDKFAGLFADLEEIGKHLSRLRESYDGALGKLKIGPGNLLAQVEDLKTLGAKAKKNLPPSPSDISNA